MIRKSLVSGLCVLAVLILGTPGLIGFYLARNFDHYAARLDRPDVMRVIGTHFERGWFKSDARITIQLADRFCSKPPCATLTLNSIIHQGPLTFTAPLANSDSYQPAWAVVVSQLPLRPLWPLLVFDPALGPVRIATHVSLAGHVSSTASLPSAQFDVKRADTIAHVAMASLRINAETALDDGPLGLTISWPLLRINGVEHGRLELHGLRAGLKTAAHNRNRIVGQHLRINSLTFGNSQGVAARLQRIVWKAGPVPGDDDGMATRFDGRINRLVINSGEYGPLKVHGRIEGVNLAMWRALKNQLIASGDEAESNASTLRTLYNLYLPPILAAGPVINISRFSLATPEGNVSGHIRISVPDDLEQPDSLVQLLDRLNLVFRGRVPAELLRDIIRWIATSHNLLGHTVTTADIDAAVAALIHKKLIKPIADDHAYHLEFSIDNGVIRINGHRQKSWTAFLNALRQPDKTFPMTHARDKMGDSP